MMMELDRMLDPQILFPVGVAISFIPGIYFIRRNKGETDSTKKNCEPLKCLAISTGIICFALLLSLPSTPALRSFGYPSDIQAVDSPQDLLSCLQQYCIAIVKTTDVILWFIFVFIFFVLGTCFQIAKILDEKQRLPKTDS